MTSDDLIRGLAAVGLLNDQDAAAWQKKATTAANDAPTLAGRLVRHELITKFQAAQALAGKAKALVLGEYVILDRLGAGAMGQVYKAEHRRMKRLVALKMLPPAMLKDETAVRRFQQQVQAAAKLLHPNIVAAFDAGEANGQHYLVIEYVDGDDLAQLIEERGPLAVDDAVDYIRQAALGLAFAHGQGVIHRDVKPANLLLDKNGVLKVADMGLARRNGSPAAGQKSAPAEQELDAVCCLAPEQASSWQAADARSDIYSLGCTFYRLLTGQNIYSGETAALMVTAHREQPVPDLRARRPGVSHQLDAIFQRMVAKRPTDRYQTMAEVVAALDTIRAGRFAGAPGPAQAEPAETETEKKRAPATKGESWRLFAKIAGGTFATIIAPIVVGLILNKMSSDQAGQVNQSPQGKSSETGKQALEVKKGDEFVSLFNGRNLDGWTTHPNQPGHWRVQDGVLIGSGKGSGYLYTKRSDFTNLRVRTQVRFNGRGNGGVYVRSSFGLRLPEDRPLCPAGYEGQIFCGQGPDPNKTGTIYMGHQVLDGVTTSPVPENEWFTLEVIANDDLIEVKVNDRTTARYRDPDRTYQIGRIALQQVREDTVVEFRDIEVCELTSKLR